jgi:hypothetical protein
VNQRYNFTQTNQQSQYTTMTPPNQGFNQTNTLPKDLENVNTFVSADCADVDDLIRRELGVDPNNVNFNF